MVAAMMMLATAMSADAKSVGKVLYIGDSMTGWLAERLNAYGALNDFTVSTIVWDGSTIRKWGNSAKLKSIIDKEDPDVVFISLGLNELLERNPEKLLSTAMNNIIQAVGSRDLVWVGPPSWPGKGKGETLVSWLKQRVGASRYFDSSDLEIVRQSKTNPHPTREGIVGWTDKIVDWLEDNPSLGFSNLKRPDKSTMTRGKSYRHVPMKSSL
ncbi:MAG: hypothetical protein NC178_01880 [Bacteroides sp.]|nr:hypothetical protein [Bacteroides sp.]